MVMLALSFLRVAGLNLFCAPSGRFVSLLRHTPPAVRLRVQQLTPAECSCSDHPENE